MPLKPRDIRVLAVAGVASLATLGGAATVAATSPTPSPSPPVATPAPTPSGPVPTPAVPVKPVVLGLSPTHGPAAGENALVISDSSWAPTHDVTVGGKPATIFETTSENRGEAGTLETSVTVLVPAGTAGTTVDVVLDNSGRGPLSGQSVPSDASKYTYDADTATPAPTSTPAPDTIPYGYTLGGSAVLKSLVKGTLPLTGSIAAQLDAESGAFTADLTLARATGNLTALGFLPVVAKVDVVSTSKVTGALADGVLTATAKVRIKLPSVTLFGVQLAGGANCQTSQISTIPLKSTAPAFNPLKGGQIAGTFPIGNLTNCGGLTGIVSPLTAGKNNAIVLSLTPKG